MSPTRGVLLKFGELFLKAGTRDLFVRHLRDNVKRLLAPFPEVRVERPYGSILVRLEAPVSEARYQEILEVCGRIYGVARVAPVRLVDKDVAAIVAAAVEETQDFVAQAGRDDLRFRLTARRADKTFRPDSRGLIELVFDALVQRFPRLVVDLVDFDFNLTIEVRDESVYLYSRCPKGACGLPVGASGSLSLLLSGGIDSPVAGLLGMKRGCHIRGIFCDSYPLIGHEARVKVERLAAILARYQGSFHLTVVPFAEIQKMFKREANGRELVLFYRRSMYRLGQRHMQAHKALGLLTGDNLGQVASQTLPNLACLDDAVEALVIRPLVCFDKSETIEMSRAHGFFEASTSAAEDPCSLFMPLHPQLAGKPEYLRKVEERLAAELTRLEDEAWANREESVLHPAS